MPLTVTRLPLNLWLVCPTHWGYNNCPPSTPPRFVQLNQPYVDLLRLLRWTVDCYITIPPVTVTFPVTLPVDRTDVAYPRWTTRCTITRWLRLRWMPGHATPLYGRLRCWTLRFIYVGCCWLVVGQFTGLLRLFRWIVVPDVNLFVAPPCDLLT